MANDSPSIDADDTELDPATQRTVVRERYADIATDEPCCGETAASGCETDNYAQSLGYSDDDLETAVSDANLELGCGNPTAIAGLEADETVLDLGSGAGFDCFIAAEQVGPEGQVIGVDMTPEMVEKARENAEQNGVRNTAFRLGEIEHLPIADESVDVILSNCVINLSPDKPQVFEEAHRVLRPGGRLAISDVVQTAPFPEGIRADPESVAACVSGASTVATLETMLDETGFVDVAIEPKADSATFIREWDEERDLSEYIVSATIEGRKP